jgi:alpha-galactosidase
MINRREFILATGGLGAAAFAGGHAVAAETAADFTPFEWSQSGLAISFDFLDKQLRQRFFLPQGLQPSLDMPKPGLHSGLEVAIHCTGENWNDHHGNKITGSMPGGRLVFAGKKAEDTSSGKRMILEHRDPDLELRVQSVYEFFNDVPVVRRHSTVSNEGKKEVGIEIFSSAMLHNFGSGEPAQMESDLRIHFAYNSWKSEGQWHSHPPSWLGLVDNGAFSLSGIFFTNVGSWSTMKYLPMGMIESRKLGAIWFWQIEHCGSWHWEISNTAARALYLYVGGPDEEHNQAWKMLRPGETYETVPAALGCVRGGFDQAVDALTRYRRKACLRPNPTNRTCHVIFNDYMNCLEGDPTTAKELPLIDSAAEAGCEYFVIDAGWYAELAETWWDSVGLWRPSKTRWPGGGLESVLRRIRDKGMVPGLWLEIEAAGINSPLRNKPDDWFFMRHGKRVIDHARFQLDFRNPDVRAHATEVFDRLVRGYGVGYIKMDYNIDVMMGTELGADSFGQGLLGHQRALLKWLENMLDKYPQLVIENCGSGGGRMEYGMLSRLQLQSSSDQTDYRKYPAILVGAMAGVLPEQLAVWSYPLSDGDADEASFNMVNAMLCRVHQSGHLAKINPHSRAQVQSGIRIYKEAIRQHLPAGIPFFPLGLPSIADEQSPVALGMRSPDKMFLAVWRLNGPDAVQVRQRQ